jgi:energy-coupling factor transporter ATP-binding protein EcfA2/energy-coupling factor transporter transmembrane protein EcfT
VSRRSAAVSAGGALEAGDGVSTGRAAAGDPATGGSAIEIRDFAVRYPTRPQPILNGLSLAIEPGERVLLAGPSGAGKSTLALAIAGLLLEGADAEIRGSVLVDGARLLESDGRPAAVQVGLLFQDPRSQFVMPRVEDDVAFGLENHAWPPAAMAGAVAAALDGVGLAAKGSWRPHELSGGEQQRAALAGSLAMAPRVIVLDEPATHLDPRSAIDLYGRIEALVRARRGTLLVIEHDLDRLLGGLVERCVVLDGNGRIVLDGPFDAVFRDPARARACAERGAAPPTPARLALALDGHARALPLHPAEAARWICADRRRLDRLRAAAASEARPEPGPVRLAARDVTVAYVRPAGTVAAVRGVSLEVRSGEVVAVVGPNGAGKSTLLRALAGLVPLADGSVGLRPLGSRAACPGPNGVGQVGLVFQNPELGFLAESVFDEVAFGLRTRGWSADRVRAATEATLGRFGLADLALENPFRLSAGQQRRLSLAAAVVERPSVLALDEPTAGLDADGRRSVVALIRALARDGTAVIVATHDGDLVAEVADRVVAIRDGEIVADRPVEAFFGDEQLLARVGQVRPALLLVLDELRRLGVDAPTWVRWSSLEPSRVEERAAARFDRCSAGGRHRPSDDPFPRSRGPTHLARADGAGLNTGLVAAFGNRSGAAPTSDGRIGRRPRPGGASSSGRRGRAAQPAVAAITELFWDADAGSWLGRRNPAAKLVAHLILTLLLTLVFDPFTPLAILAGTLVAGRVLAGLALAQQARRLSPFWLLGLAVLLSNALFANDPRGATIVVAIGPVRATVEGLLIGLSLAERMVAVGALSVLFVATTEPGDLVRSLVQQLHLPARIAYPMLAAYQFLPILADEWQTISDAQALRGGRAEGGAVRDRLARWLWAMRLLLTAAIRRTERVALAMDARGFGRASRRTHYRHLRVDAADVGLVLGAVILGGAVVGVSAAVGVLRLWTGVLST